MEVFCIHNEEEKRRKGSAHPVNELIVFAMTEQRLIILREQFKGKGRDVVGLEAPVEGITTREDISAIKRSVFGVFSDPGVDCVKDFLLLCRDFEGGPGYGPWMDHRVLCGVEVDIDREQVSGVERVHEIAEGF